MSRMHLASRSRVDAAWDLSASGLPDAFSLRHAASYASPKRLVAASSKALLASSAIVGAAAFFPVALVRRPRVLILDDATSAVDPVVEAEILAGLRRALETTTLVVAHRVSTIELADRVLFIDAGRVEGIGAHNELLRSHPGYARIVRAYEAGSAA